MKKHIIPLLAPLLLLTSCYKEDDYLITNINPDEVILKVELTGPSPLPADATTSLNVRVIVSPDADTTLNSVELKTTSGTFPNGSNTIKLKPVATSDSNGELQKEASSRIISSQVAEELSVYVTVGGITEIVKTQQIANKATYIKSLTASSVVIGPDPTDEITFVATVSADAGKVTIGEGVGIRVLDNTNTMIGVYRVSNELSNSDEECSWVFSKASHPNFTGELNVEVFLKSDPSVNKIIPIYAQ